MNKKLLYKKAYSLLELSTPLKIDCGTLCGKACCKGNEDTGMYLYPGEEEALAAADFLTIKPVNIEWENTGNILLAVCKGSCDRKLRPLGCRIFPLVPCIGSDGQPAIILDPRAAKLCPIARYSSIDGINRLFVSKVRSVFRLLLEDSDIREFVKLQSRILEDYISLK